MKVSNGPDFQVGDYIRAALTLTIWKPYQKAVTGGPVQALRCIRTSSKLERRGRCVCSIFFLVVMVAAVAVIAVCR